MATGEQVAPGGGLPRRGRGRGNSRFLLFLAALFLATWGLTLLLLRGTVAYALGDATPADFDQAVGLAQHVDRYVRVTGTPDHTQAVAYRRYGIPSYWYPLPEYDHRVVVKTGDPLPASTGSSPQQFRGRLRPLRQVAFSGQVADLFLQERGLRLPSDSYVVSVDEPPELFRPMLLLAAPVTVVWFGLLLGLGGLAVRALLRKTRR